MKRTLIFFTAISMLLLLFACKSKQETAKSDEAAGLKSPVTEGNTLCVCAEFDTDADIIALLSEEGYTFADLATGSFRESSNKLLHTDDSDMFIYTFDDAFLAGKAYTAILNCQADGAYPTNFTGLSGSLVRMGRYLIDDNIASTGTGDTLRKVFSVAGIEVPKAQEQKGFEKRVTASEKGVLNKGFKKHIRQCGYQILELDISIHGAQKSYLILEDNGIIAGRLDITAMETDSFMSYAEAVAQAYNEKIGITFNSDGYALFTWYEDCIEAVFSETTDTDTATSEASASAATKSEG